MMAFCNSGLKCFNPRAPRGARPAYGPESSAMSRFNPRAPRGARPVAVLQLCLDRLVSIHAPRAGRDNMRLPRLSCGYGFNPRAPRGARPIILLSLFSVRNVSIHAPRAGRDRVPIARFPWGGCFNPRAPRGARQPRRGRQGAVRRVSIHAPRAGRDRSRSGSRESSKVSIHAPRAGRDGAGHHHHRRVEVFQSTRPARGATAANFPGLKAVIVSIHAPRAGRDDLRGEGVDVGRSFNPRAPRGARRRPFGKNRLLQSFNPRAPRGARPRMAGASCFSRLFQSTRPARGATLIHPRQAGRVWFQSTRPARGATFPFGIAAVRPVVSIHAPRAGRDSRPAARAGRHARFNPRAPRGARRQGDQMGDVHAGFNPRAPRGARRWTSPLSRRGFAFQSTRPARGATVLVVSSIYSFPVSIHAPRAGRDRLALATTRSNASFNPRAPRGARLTTWPHTPPPMRFQSTRPARGATSLASWDRPVPDSFNPRAPRGARPNIAAATPVAAWFQSTRPARGATGPLPAVGSLDAFQSTRPARGATGVLPFRTARGRVSIHAPRAGRDRGVHAAPKRIERFNPRAPRGARLIRPPAVLQALQFQSTRPARGATRCPGLRCQDRLVSIHAPRAGRDADAAHHVLEVSSFNPRAPRGARQGRPDGGVVRENVSIHAPRAGRDVAGAVHWTLTIGFQSTRPARGATTCELNRVQYASVSIHAPRAGRDRGKNQRRAR